MEIIALLFLFLNSVSEGFLLGKDEICCEEDGVGCFQKEGAFSHLPLPECPGKMGIELGLYTRSNPNIPVYVDKTGAPQEFDGRRRTVFIVHGFFNDYNSDYIHHIKDALLEKEDLNAIIVGWGGGAGNIYYPQSASNTRSVGAALALYARTLDQNQPDASMWCIGFSLGSHLCGHMGARTHLHRITGLDPAGPSFDSYDIEVGLNPGSADFVDVIHTDGAGIIAFYGTLRPLGHVDYYPNEGHRQPGCLTRRDIHEYEGAPNDAQRVQHMIDYAQAISDGIITRGEGLSCSHGRAHKYFLSSIKNENCFVAKYICSSTTNMPESCTLCSSDKYSICGIMGYLADKYTNYGNLYHETSGSGDFCLSQTN